MDEDQEIRAWSLLITNVSYNDESEDNSMDSIIDNISKIGAYIFGIENY
jgi:hypothetical protein